MSNLSRKVRYIFEYFDFCVLNVLKLIFILGALFVFDYFFRIGISFKYK